jgi:hypothetical protein
MLSLGTVTRYWRRCTRDQRLPIGLRLDAAKAAVAYERPRLAQVAMSRRAIRFSSIIILRVNVSTQLERIRSRSVPRVSRRYNHGDPDNVIAFAMVCYCA